MRPDLLARLALVSIPRDTAATSGHVGFDAAKARRARGCIDDLIDEGVRPVAVLPLQRAGQRNLVATQRPSIANEQPAL
jgi:hypothetical protein